MGRYAIIVPAARLEDANRWAESWSGAETFGDLKIGHGGVASMTGCCIELDREPEDAPPWARVIRLDDDMGQAHDHGFRAAVAGEHHTMHEETEEYQQEFGETVATEDGTEAPKKEGDVEP